MSMTAKQRMLITLDGGKPDRLPVTTHFLMPQFLNTCMAGMSLRVATRISMCTLEPSVPGQLLHDAAAGQGREALAFVQ